jgi:hypothetical protein
MMKKEVKKTILCTIDPKKEEYLRNEVNGLYSENYKALKNFLKL